MLSLRSAAVALLSADVGSPWLVRGSSNLINNQSCCSADKRFGYTTGAKHANIKTTTLVTFRTPTHIEAVSLTTKYSHE